MMTYSPRANQAVSELSSLVPRLTLPNRACVLATINALLFAQQSTAQTEQSDQPPIAQEAKQN